MDDSSLLLHQSFSVSATEQQHRRKDASFVPEVLTHSCVACRAQQPRVCHATSATSATVKATATCSTRMLPGATVLVAAIHTECMHA
jgi:hypothetical protein